MDNNDSQISEGEIETDSQTTILVNLEGLIKQNISSIGKLEEEAKKYKEMIDSILQNDEVYQTHEKQAKDAVKLKSSTKAEILKRQEVKQTADKLKELKTEIREIKESMSSYLTEYQRLSGSSQVENEEGELMEIVYTAKLVKRRSF